MEELKLLKDSWYDEEQGFVVQENLIISGENNSN